MWNWIPCSVLESTEQGGWVHALGSIVVLMCWNSCIQFLKALSKGLGTCIG